MHLLSSLGGLERKSLPERVGPDFALDDPEVLWLEALVHSASPLRAEIVAVHQDTASGEKSLDVSCK